MMKDSAMAALHVLRQHGRIISKVANRAFRHHYGATPSDAPRRCSMSSAPLILPSGNDCERRAGTAMLDRRLQLGLDGRRGAAAGLKESGVSASAADFRSARFRTEELPERERLPFFLDVFGRKVVRQEMEPMAGSRFHVDLVMRSLPGLNVWSGAYSPMSLRRTRTLLADGNDDVALCTAPKGGTTLSHCGRDLTTRDGDAVLISRCDPIAVTRVDQAHHLGISVPRKVLAATVIGLEDALMRPVPADTGALQLLRSYLGVLKDDLRWPRRSCASRSLRTCMISWP
jgi:AraC-binding-like domain